MRFDPQRQSVMQRPCLDRRLNEQHPGRFSASQLARRCRDWSTGLRRALNRLPISKLYVPQDQRTGERQAQFGHLPSGRNIEPGF